MSLSATDVLGFVGSTVDQIRFDACIDVGGFGIVYRGQHLGLGEPVAIKCLRLSHVKTEIVGQQTAESATAKRNAIAGRFRDETKLLYHLAQGNLDITRCISSGELFSPKTGERVPYMVLEWLEGRTLSEDLDERRSKRIPGRSLAETLDLIESAALALAYAHGQGVVHRDIKPGNLFLARTRRGHRLKVLDFGVAKILSDESLGFGQSVTTADGVHLVSPSYAAPEQFSRQGGRIGPWTDVYSLTLVLYEVMLGEKVRGGSRGDPNPTIAPRASNLGLTIPRPIEELLARAVAQNPLERPANAGVFWSAIRELARQSVPPVSDAAALAATAYDGDVGAAMLKVRAASASPSPAPVGVGGVGPNGSTVNMAEPKSPVPGSGSGSAPSPVSIEPSPFTGTMLMVNAPGGGALQLFEPQITTKPAEPSTAPLMMPAVPPAPVGQNAVTAGIAIPSPLAASLGPGIQSPVQGIAPPPPQPQAQQQQQMQAPHLQQPMTPPVSSMPPPMRMHPSVPPQQPPQQQLVIPQPQTRGPGLIIAVIVLVLLAIVGVAVYLLLYPRA